MEVNFRELLAHALRDAGISLQEALLDQLINFYLLYEKWQRSLNLSAIRDADVIADRHFVESLILIQKIEKKDGRLLDFGSGNGFPAMPIKLALPELELTMVESRLKKCHFLHAAVRELGLDKVTIINRRFDDLSEIRREKYYDYFTMRGVGQTMKIFAGLPSILKKGGLAFIYTGKKNLPFLESVARKIGAKHGDIQLPNRRVSCISVLEMP